MAPSQKARRLLLQQKLEDILGSRHVYFQPPENIRMQYPCIVYKRSTTATRYSDNVPYSRVKQYTVTVIDSNPDSDIPDKVAELPTCKHNRFFVTQNLNHDVFNLFF